ncbi:MAG TPA: AAA family ATPase [Limnochordales bacterium]
MAARPVTAVRWSHLVLHGFGRFAGTVSLEFGPGLNVLVAPNEAGKSTLLAGLAAVLFGLPATTDPDKFGQGRWRNWSGAPRFAGELEFEAGEGRFRIQRDFANHRISVARWTGAGWQPLLTGEHNPHAKRRHVRYEEFLQETVGITSRELFMSTFAMGQPLPEPHGLDADVQQLLSGAGTASFRQALEQLVSGVRAITKYSRALGVTDRDALKDGQLEKLDERIAELEAEIARSQGAADSLEVIQAELSRLQQEEAAARQRCKEAEDALAAWSQWRSLLLRRRSLLKEYAQLVRAWETVQKLEAAHEEKRLRLQDEFPELAKLADGGNVGSDLVRLEQLQERVRAAREAAAKELVDLKGRVAELLREWGEYRAERARLAALEAELETYGVFAAASPAEREMYASYTAQRMRLERQLEEARAALAAWKEPFERYWAEKDRYGQAFADLEAWSDDDLAAVEKQLALAAQRSQAADRLREIQDRMRELEPKTRARVALAWALLLLLGGGLAFVFYGEGGWGAALSVLSLMGALLTSLTIRLQAPALELEWQASAIEKELKALDKALAADERLKDLSPAALAALRERLLQRQQAAAALADLRRQLPPYEQERELAARVQAAERALAAFLAATAPARERFGDGVETAFRRWTTLTDQAAARREWLLGFARRHAGIETLALEEVPADRLPGAWGQLASLLASAGRPPATVGELAAQLEALPPDFWDSALAAREQEPPLAGWLAEIDSLRQRLDGVLAVAGGDPAAARRRWEAFRDAQEDLARLERERAGVLRAHDVSTPAELQERLLDVQSQAAAAWQQLEQWSAAHPGLPHPDEAEDGEVLEAKVRKLEEERDRWQAQAEAAAAEVRQLLQEQVRLQGSQVINIAQAQEQLAALRRERDALALEARAMARAHQELAAAVAEYQGTHRVRLAETATRYFQRFSGRNRRVELDEGFAVKVVEPDGQECAVAQLSQGAQDQLYLALRLAIADLVGGSAPLPLLLDDPFVNCDAERLARIRAALEEASVQRQIVLFSHRNDFAAWGRPVHMEEDRPSPAHANP